jgi:cell division protein FtsB
MSTLLTKSIESLIKTAISEATVGLHKKIETQEKEISDLKAESSQIKIENRRLNDTGKNLHGGFYRLYETC